LIRTDELSRLLIPRLGALKQALGGVLGCITIAVGVAALFAPAFAQVSEPRAQIIVQTDEQLIFEVEFPAPVLTSARLAERDYVRVDMPGCDHSGAEGEPDLPVREWLVALPPGAEPLIETMEETRIFLAEARPAPVPVQDLTFPPGDENLEDKVPGYRLEYAEDPALYESARVFPERPVSSEAARSWRLLRVVPLTLHPVAYDPTGGTLTWTPRLRVRVLFARPKGKAAEPPSTPYRMDEPSWESLYRDRILNYRKAPEYRRAPLDVKTSAAQEAPRVGMAGEAPRLEAAQAAFEFRILVDSTGVYQLPFERLVQAGLEITALEWDRLALVVRDYDDDALEQKEIPIAFLPFGDQGNGLFEAGESIVFYGQQAWDFFAFTGADKRFGRENAYWLVYGAAAGPRMEEIDSSFGWDALPAPTVYERTVHFEQNRYLGDMKVYQDTSGPFDGPLALASDHYNWTDPTAGAKPIKVISFGMPSILRATKVCVHLQGQFYVQDMASIPHRPRLWLSSSAAPEDTTLPRSQAFSGNPYVISSLRDYVACDERPISTTVTKAGRNYLKIYLPREHDGIDNVNGDKVGIDWFEVTYTGAYELYEGLLQAPLALTGPQRFIVRKVPSQDALVLDIGDRRAPRRLRVTPDQYVAGSGGTWNLNLQMDCGDGTEPHEFLVATGAGFVPLSAKAVEMRPAPSLDTFGGEDYVVVYPRRFESALAPLIDLRRSQGHRVLAAPVEDVYDTYTGGRPHPFAIKRLMRAMWRRSSPVPDYLLLYGDGSNDMGGYALDLAGQASDTTYVPTISNFGHSFGVTGIQLVSTDAWFVDNLGGSWTARMNFYPDVHVGRVSCGSEEEAAIYAEKVVRYETTDPTGGWRQRLVIVSDDDYSGEGFNYCRQGSEYRFLQISRNAAAAITSDSIFDYLEVDSLYLNGLMDSIPELGRCVRDTLDPSQCLRDAQGRIVVKPVGNCADLRVNTDFGRGRLRDIVFSSLNRGALAFAYQGHSHSRQMAHERFFVNYASSPSDGNDVAALGNLYKPFVYHGYGCHLAEFGSRMEANPFRGDALSEAMLFCCPGAPRGAIGAIGSTDYEQIGHDFQEKVFQAMFTDPPSDARGARRWRLGEIVDWGKAKLTSNRLERITYTLLGDPALRHGALPPWIDLTLEGLSWTEGTDGEYVSGRADDSLRVRIELLDESQVGQLPEVRDYDGLVPPERLVVIDSTSHLGRSLTVEYRTRVERRPYALSVRSTDYEGLQRELRVTMPFGIELYEQAGQALEPLRDGASLADSSRLAVTVRSGAHLDAADVRLLLDGAPVALAQAMLDEPAGEARTWTLRYEGLPVLSAGEKRLSVEIVQRDGSPLELLSRTVSVGRQGPLAISFAYWMPNPFEGESNLVYHLTDTASRARLRIFTSSGREILDDDTLPVTRGTRGYRWDGRDADGDPVANGLYFFELSVWDGDGRRSETRILDKVLRVR